MLSRFLQHLRSVPVLAGLLAVALVALLQFSSVPMIERLGLLLFDSYQRAAPREYQDAGVKIVDIDEESVARLGQWPWPRTEIARLTDRLAQAGVAAIAFDIVFSEGDRTSPEKIAQRNPDLADVLAGLPANDEVLADSFALSPVVNGFFLIGEERGGDMELPSGLAVLGSPPTQGVDDFAGVIAPLPLLRETSAGLGSLSIVGDDDGIVRKAPLLFFHDRKLVSALSVEALRVALGADATLVKTSDGTGENASAPGSVVSLRVGDFEVPTTAAGELWSYFTGPVPERTLPAWQVLDAATPADALVSEFEGRIVFVGASATGLRDLVTTPLSEGEPGVMVHAQAAEQMILGQFLERPDWARGLEATLLIVLGVLMALLLPKLGATIGAAVGLLGTASVGVGSWLAFDQLGYLLNPTYPILALVLAYAVQTVISYYREERQRAYIHNAFDRYLSPEMVRQIAADPDKLELGGEEREMTVLFCDIRGFSRISEQFQPNEVIDFLITFLTPMCEVLLDRKATVDKFIGDAILAFWNAPLDDPDQFRNGARSALEMVAALDLLNQQMPGRKDQVWPDDVQIGIGLNSGLCCVGNMGSQQRLSYSLIGDTVNIASRFEGLTKQYGVKIIVGSALAEHLDGFAMLELDRVKVVGREAPDTIFALLGDEAFARSDDFKTLLEAQQRFVAAYRKQNWDEAEAILTASHEAYDDAGIAGLVTTYRARFERLRAADLPAEWDGVFQATSK